MNNTSDNGNSRQEIRIKFLDFIAETSMRNDKDVIVPNIENFATMSKDEKEQTVKEYMAARGVIFRRKFGDFFAMCDNNVGGSRSIAI